MNQKPVFLTTYALTRLLKEFAGRLGLDNDMADVSAQLHVHQSSIPGRWSEFITNNCARCGKEPNTCDYMNPQPHNCSGDSTPDEVRSANAMVIELGKMQRCPSWVAPKNPA